MDYILSIEKRKSQGVKKIHHELNLHRQIWKKFQMNTVVLSDCNGTWTHNQLLRLDKWFSIRERTK